MTGHFTRHWSIITAPGAFAALVVLLLLIGCEEQNPLDANGIAGPRKSPLGNEPPQTHLSLILPPGTLPDTSLSAKTINWWGEDLDGRVVEYEYRWGQVQYNDSLVAVDTLWYDGDFRFSPGEDEVWVSTTAEKADFVLPIRSVSATFTLQVRAVDDDGLVDPTPAEIGFPIINSKPAIDFRLGSNPTAGSTDTTEIDTTFSFPVRTFVWDASDPDGNESIAKILYALDPAPEDTAWQELAGNESSVTLTDLESGRHTFWVKAEDVAGFQSPRIHYPDEANKTVDPDTWWVKLPAAGGYLIVDDFKLENNNSTLHKYEAIFDSLYNGGADGEDEVYSVWELEQLPYATTDVTQSLLMFDRVLWFSFRGQPLLRDAFNSMYTFINTPGNRMLLTTINVDSGTAGVDEGMLLDIADGIEFFSSRFGTIPSDSVYMEPVDDLTLPEMLLSGLLNFHAYRLIPSAGAEVIYQLDISTSDPPQYEGTPIVGARRTDKSYTLITLPLHLVVDDAQVATMIRNTFE